MNRFLFDEDFNRNILKGLHRKRAELPIVRVQDTHVAGRSDREILEFAATENRIVITHDANTMIQEARLRIANQRGMPGLVVVRQTSPVALVIDDLLLVIDSLKPGEWESLIHFLPW